MANLPAQHERSAPCFDDTRPEEVERYFSDLEDLFTVHAVANENERKQAAIRYLKAVGTEKLWRSSPAFSSAANTYDEFKAEVLRLYPSAGVDRTYSIQDLDRLISERARVGIYSANDIADYFRQFLLISRYLIGKGRLSTIDQSRNFIRGFSPNLAHQVMQRLQLRFPTHMPEDPYRIDDVYDAANFIIGGPTQGAFLSTPAQAPQAGQYQPAPYWPQQQAHASPATYQSPYAPMQAATPAPADPATVKIKALTAAVASLGEMLKTAIEAQQGGGKPRSAGPRPAGASGAACNFCGGTGHFIRECEVVTEYNRAGKCKRSTDGKVVLPSGAMVPRDIQGTWLRDCVDEWHRQNPGQVASQMILEVATAPSVPAPSRESACQPSTSYPAQYASQGSEVSQPGTYALRRVPATRPDTAPRPPPARDNTGPAARNSQGSGGDAASTSLPGELPPAQPQKQGTSPVKTGQTTSEQATIGQAHPFAATQDASPPPRAGAPPPCRGDQAYTTTAKIYDDKVATEVYNRAMELPITVTQRELLSLAPELRAQVTDANIKRRIPRDTAQILIEEIQEAAEEQNEAQLSHMPAAFTTAANPPRIEPATADNYFKATPTAAETQEEVEVAAESNALRAILPVVDGQDQVEAILDPGCQVVAMSEEVCNALAIAYDPDVHLSMVSANGGVDQSLGLARNVSFLVGDITLYLQVHILRSPAYDILLGRPFDTLTQSVVCNFRNENQTITIKDPNSGKSATIPTVARGSNRFAERRARSQVGQGF